MYYHNTSTCRQLFFRFKKNTPARSPHQATFWRDEGKRKFRFLGQCRWMRLWCFWSAPNKLRTMNQSFVLKIYHCKFCDLLSSCNIFWYTYWKLTEMGKYSQCTDITAFRIIPHPSPEKAQFEGRSNLSCYHRELYTNNSVVIVISKSAAAVLFVSLCAMTSESRFSRREK